MKKLFLAILILAGLGCLNEVGAEVFDINKAKFKWDYPAGAPTPTHFRFKCATVKDGPHTLIVTIADGSLREYPMIKVIGTQRGNYECFLTALVQIDSTNELESGPSNEVFFSAAVGASIPLNLTVGE